MSTFFDICAYIEASKELALGNYEFADAAPNCLDKVLTWRNKFESVDYFCTTFLPQINQTIENDFICILIFYFLEECKHCLHSLVLFSVGI